MSSFFENISGNKYNDNMFIEQATLQEDIRVYVYKNYIGKFHIPILFPLVDKGEVKKDIYIPPSTKNIHSDKLLTVKRYYKQNYIDLVIPKYIVSQFNYIIPRGTKFIVCFIGGGVSISDINIIGLVGKYLQL